MQSDLNENQFQKLQDNQQQISPNQKQILLNNRIKNFQSYVEFCNAFIPEKRDLNALQEISLQACFLGRYVVERIINGFNIDAVDEKNLIKAKICSILVETLLLILFPIGAIVFYGCYLDSKLTQQKENQEAKIRITESQDRKSDIEQFPQEQKQKQKARIKIVESTNLAYNEEQFEKLNKNKNKLKNYQQEEGKATIFSRGYNKN